MNKTRILIGADLVPTESNYGLFRSGDVSSLCGQELTALLNSADYRIFNLETPLTDQKTPIEKVGPCLGTPCDAAAGIRAIGADLVTLANNHILDQGAQGLESTLRVLAQQGIACCGVGQNLKEAAAPYIATVNGRRIGIYCCAEHEFSIAGEDTPGANPFDPLESPDHIAALRSQCDYLICLHHGGKEHYRYPSPDLQKTCRKIVEKGADLVLCQHSHCIGAREEYLGGTIVYGQGNFLFVRSDSEFWKTSLLIEVELDETVCLRYHPLVKTENGVRLADAAAGEEILREFGQRSEEIARPGFIRERYREFGREQATVLLQLGGRSRENLLLRLINKLSGYRFAKWYVGKKYKRSGKRIIRNRIQCEAWRELLLSVLEE